MGGVPGPWAWGVGSRKIDEGSQETECWSWSKGPGFLIGSLAGSHKSKKQVLNDEVTVVATRAAISEKLRTEKSKRAELQIKSSKYVARHGVDNNKIDKTIRKHDHVIPDVVVIDALNNEQYLRIGNRNKQKKQKGEPPEF